MRLTIDWTRCDSHGLCAALAPEHITRDEWGFPLIVDGDLDPRDARRVAAACPALALRCTTTTDARRNPAPRKAPR